MSDTPVAHAGHFKKGMPRAPGAGRRPGSKNQVTLQVKEAILRALDEVGGHKYLVKVAEENPAVFCTLLGKILPMQVNLSNGKEFKLTVNLPDGYKPDPAAS